MTNELRDEIAAVEPDLIALRHDLHRHPELSGREKRTAGRIAEQLRALGLQPRTGVGGHGVVADLDGAAPGPTLALRADMDALPIAERSELPYRSEEPGVMHACGHDGHTTVLLGAAHMLSGRRDRLAGRVRFLFQPAEETVGGAVDMCAQGAMDGVDAIVALHGWPGLPIGQVGLRIGPMMASADTFDILVRGHGTHAAYPHLGVDPVIAGAEIVLALQRIVSREVDPLESAVLTVARFEAGTAYNVIPETAGLGGTVRTLSPHVRDAMPERIRRIAESVCAASGATCEVVYRHGTAPVVNDAGIVALVRRVAGTALGPGNVIDLAGPSMGAEDFAAYLAHAPGAIFRLGVGDTSALHTPTYDFADGALPVGVELLCRIAEAYCRAPAAGPA